MPAKKSRRTYTAKKKTTAKRSVRSVSKKRKQALPIKAFRQAIGRKFQSVKESETHVVPDKKSKAKGRREGL